MSDFKSVNPNNREFVKTRKWKDWVKENYVIGKVVPCSEVDKFKKPIFALIVQESNFGAEVGKPIYLNCGGNFKNLMDMVEEGETIKVVYRGMNKIKKGQWAGTETYDIDVQIAAEGGAASEDAPSSSDSDGLL
jgi:hypothetical protein